MSQMNQEKWPNSLRVSHSSVVIKAPNWDLGGHGSIPIGHSDFFCLSQARDK